MWTNLHKSCECKPKGQLTWNWVNPIKYSKFLTIQLVFLCNDQLLNWQKQSRGVASFTQICTCVLEKLVDFLLQVKGISSVVTWPCIFHFFIYWNVLWKMSFGKCHQKIPPDFPSLRVSTPSKSHATPLNKTLLLAKWIFMNYRPFYINANETPNDTIYSRIDKILQTREKTISSWSKC